MQFSVMRRCRIHGPGGCGLIESGDDLFAMPVGQPITLHQHPGLSAAMSCWIVSMNMDGTVARLKEKHPLRAGDCPAFQSSVGKGLDMIDLAGIFVFSGSFALLGILIGAPKAYRSFQLWWQKANDAVKSELNGPTHIHRHMTDATMRTVKNWALDASGGGGGEGEGGMVKWALKFEATGEMHQYTLEQMREKFGVEQVRPGMEVCHNTQGRATVVTAFHDKAGHRTTQDSEPTTTNLVQHTSKRRVGKKWKRLAAPAAPTQDLEVEVQTYGGFGAGKLEAILAKLDAQELALQAQTALIEDRFQRSPPSSCQPCITLNSELSITPLRD